MWGATGGGLARTAPARGGETGMWDARPGYLPLFADEAAAIREQGSPFPVPTVSTACVHCISWVG